MPIRRPQTRLKQTLRSPDLAAFNWDPGTLAVLHHSTLPWFEEFPPGLTPLMTAATGISRRDALSLLGQYAAHLAFLRLAGISDTTFDASQWAVEIRRGRDARLVRLGAGRASEDVAPSENLRLFAGIVAVSDLESVKATWIKPDVVYHEIDRRLREASAADLAWFRRSASGLIRSPGTEGMQSLAALSVRAIISDDEQLATTVQLLSRSRTIVSFGTEATSPLHVFSAVPPHLHVPPGSHPSDAAEHILQSTGQQSLIYVRHAQRFDAQSRLLVRMLSEAGDRLTWLVDSQSAELLSPVVPAEMAGPSRLFVVSPRTSAARDLETFFQLVPPSLRFQRLEEFVQGNHFSAFLDQGTIPEAEAASSLGVIPEPKRSYLAALSLFGPSVAVSIAARLLTEFGSRLSVTDLAQDGIAVIDDASLRFQDETIRLALVKCVPDSSRAGLAAAAAGLIRESGDPAQSAALYLEAGKVEDAISIIERVSNDADSSRRMAMIDLLAPGDLARSSLLTAEKTRLLIQNGRYVSAKELSARLPHPMREFLMASCERRLGHYGAALDLMDQVTPNDRDFENWLLRGELLRLCDRYDESREAFAQAAILGHSTADKLRLGYERSMLAFDAGEAPAEAWLDLARGTNYWCERYRTYRALNSRDYAAGQSASEHALAAASGISEKVDAALDLMNTRFLAGEWEDARREARTALILLEETEGDRGAGGVLFTLSYLCADEGLFQESQQKIERLRHFYRATGDHRRLNEIDLLVGHLAFSRGDWDEARRMGESVLRGKFGDEIMEAARIMLDELDLITGNDIPLRGTGQTACAELSDRHWLNVSRKTGTVEPRILSSFARTLSAAIATARSGGSLSVETNTPSERLRLFRSLLALQNIRRRDDEIAAAERLRVDLNLRPPPKPSSRSVDAELEILRRTATRPFPFQVDDFGGIAWRFCSQNRLGHWNELGSGPQPLAKDDLDILLSDIPAGWVRCGDRAFFFLEGLDRWSGESRESLAALVALKSEMHGLQRRIEQDERAASTDPSPATIDGLIGHSPAVRDLLGLIGRVAKRDVPVSIQGESGTGKELVARAIHRSSLRKGKVFTPVNCAALPENLIESELFGHVRGAFTGADRDRAGLIESSDGGTLFLDEIGELPMTAQAKLLRFLQEGEYRRVGEAAVRSADVRIVAATNRNLENAVDAGSFREDLYYRIRGVEIAVAPLRERGSDIILLANHFLAREHEKHRGGPMLCSEEVEAVLLSYRWPGNVRELQNTMRAAHAIAGDARRVELEHLPERLQGIVVVRKSTGTFFEEIVRFRRTLVEKSLLDSKGNQNQAAKLLGMSRQALAYQIKELGILVKSTRAR